MKSNNPSAIRCLNHRVEYILSEYSRAGKVKIKCVDCSFLVWDYPKDAILLVGRNLRCSNIGCENIYKMDMARRDQIVFVCDECAKRFIHAS